MKWTLGLRAPRIAVVLLGLLLVGGGVATADEKLALEIPAALRPATGPGPNDVWAYRFLPSRQSPDGSWSARDWDRWCGGYPQRPDPRLPGRATADHDLSVTSLATCAFLGAGYTHRGRHPHSRTVSRAMRWLKRRQTNDGSFARPGDVDPIVAHAIASLAVIETFGMTDSPVYRAPARRALAFLRKAQRPSGAWPLPSGRGEDPLATFWAGLALKSASLINKDRVRRDRSPFFPPEVTQDLARAAAWFTARTDAATGIVAANKAEHRRGATSLVLTAAGALLRVFAGENPRGKALQPALQHLAQNRPTRESQTHADDGLYGYIATLVLFQAGGKYWEHWKKALDRVIERQIRTRGVCGLRGSWAPRGTWSRGRGRLAMTALMSMALQVYYRYDRVFGAKDIATAQQRLPSRLQVLQGEATWQRSGLPLHAARMTLAEGGTLPIDAVHVRADVHGVRAQVVLDLFLTNTNRRMHEGVLDLRLPDGASPYYLAFGKAALEKVPVPGAVPTALATDLASLHEQREGEWGRVLEARMAPVGKATKAFEEIVRKRKDPALLTWSGAGVYHLRVFPLEPGKQHRIVLAYEVDLTLVDDGATLHVGLPADVPEVRVAVRAEGRVRTWRNPGTTDIPVRVALPGDVWLKGTDAADRMHTAAWIKADVPAIERKQAPRAQILVDVSKSVRAEQMRVWRELVPLLLTRNADRIREFSVGFFDQRTRWFRQGYVANTPENVAALRKALDDLEPGGATDLAQALRALGAEGEADVFLFTDGLRTYGETARGSVVKALPRGRRVFAYDVGLSRDDGMLAELTEHSDGALIAVLGGADILPAVRAHRFAPWHLQSVAVPGLEDILLAGNPKRVYPGQRLRLAARGVPTQDAVLSLRVRRYEEEEDRVVRVPVSTPTASPMAARAYGVTGVERLESASDRVASIAKDYAMHYRVVRRSCALVMLEREEQYKQYGLDTTGHAERVAEHTVSATLVGDLRLQQRPSTFSLGAYASSRGVHPALQGALSPTGRAAPQTWLPDDPVLRTLGSALEGEPSGSERVQFALHAYARGRPDHALHVLLPTEGIGVSGASLWPPPWPVRDWLTARAAQEAGKPQLALVAYEAALGARISDAHSEISWVIAADYERCLKRLLREDLPAGLARFARARLTSLALWRRTMLGEAPPAEAALVVLHQPYDRRNDRRIEIHGPEGALALEVRDGPARGGVRTFPLWPGGDGPQMTVLGRMPRGCVSVHLAEPEEEPDAVFLRRSLVIVVRDWGRAKERVLLVAAADRDAGCLLRVGR